MSGASSTVYARPPEADGNTVLVARSALGDLDIVLERFTALPRISELEARVRHAGFHAIDIARLIEHIHDLYEPLAEERGIKLSISCAPCDPLRVDEKLLFEALSNLVDNAIKFTPEGGRVTLSFTCDAAGPVIIVQDKAPVSSGGGSAPRFCGASTAGRTRRTYQVADLA